MFSALYGESMGSSVISSESFCRNSLPVISTGSLSLTVANSELFRAILHEQKWYFTVLSVFYRDEPPLVDVYLSIGTFMASMTQGDITRLLQDISKIHFQRFSRVSWPPQKLDSKCRDVDPLLVQRREIRSAVLFRSILNNLTVIPEGDTTRWQVKATSN